MTHVDAMLHHAICQLPESFKDQLILMQLLNSGYPVEQQRVTSDVFYDFLKAKKLSIEKFGACVLDEIIKEDQAKTKYCKKCSKKHAEGACQAVQASVNAQEVTKTQQKKPGGKSSM